LAPDRALLSQASSQRRHDTRIVTNTCGDAHLLAAAFRSVARELRCVFERGFRKLLAQLLSRAILLIERLDAELLGPVDEQQSIGGIVFPLAERLVTFPPGSREPAMGQDRKAMLHVREPDCPRQCAA
jgi:hypothetical protein